MNATIKISGYQLAAVNDLLSGRVPCYEREGFLIVDEVEYFTDGYRVRVTVTADQRLSTCDVLVSLPYCDVVLFDEGGNVVETFKNRAKLDGEYRFDDGHTFWIEEEE